MPKEPAVENQATQSHRPDLEETLVRKPDLGETVVHTSDMDATLPRPRVQPPAPAPVPSYRPDLEDTQPGRPVAAPEAAPRSRKKRRRRSFGGLRRIALLTGLLATGLVIFLVALYRIAPPPRTNILVMGIDSRAGEGWLARSDSLMLVTVDPESLYVGMLSIPRDLYLDIPGYGLNRINVAHVLGEQEGTGGGPRLVARTIQQDFGVPVQKTVRLKFDGFVAIIDAAGGVDINVTRRIVDTSYPTANYGTMTVTFEPGLQHMDGQRALIYARTRHADSDFYRAKRQQEVLSALVAKLSSPQNWTYLPAVYMAVSQNVETDLTVWDAAVLAPTLLWVGTGGIDRQEIDENMATGFQGPGGAAVLQPHWDLINPLIQQMFLD